MEGSITWRSSSATGGKTLPGMLAGSSTTCSGVALSVAFWGHDVLISIPGLGGVPDPEILPTLQGRLGKNEDYRWYLRPGAEVPDLTAAEKLAKDRRSQD